MSKIGLCLLSLVLGALTGINASAATLTAASPAYADVSAKVSAASNGDTVIIPAGSATWTTTLTITKGITLQGAGSNSTLITGNNVQFIKWSCSSDLPIRLTGIGFSHTAYGGSASLVVIAGSGGGGSSSLTKVRVDNCSFTYGTRAFSTAGYVYGVADHCTFTNCNIGYGPNGDSSASWNRPIEPGSGNSFFVEDCNFIVNNGATSEPNEAVYLNDGARAVIRHNTFDSTAYTNGYTAWLDSHGNYDNPNSFKNPIAYRGQPLAEYYDNVFKGHHSYRQTNLRGGTIFFWNNAFTSVGASGTILEITEEDGWQTVIFSPLDVTWPAYDQITDSYFYNNTNNGLPITTINRPHTSDLVFLQQNRDYYLRAPQAGDKYYPYTPYTYPHPLAGGGTTAVAPSNARIGISTP